MIKKPHKRKFLWPTTFIQQKLHTPLLNVIRSRSGYQSIVIKDNDYDLVVASYNIHKCVGVDKVFNPTRIVRVIAELKADILALQEADKRFGERKGLIDLQLLKAETGLFPVPLNTMSPHGHGWHGNALFCVRDVYVISYKLLFLVLNLVVL